MYKCQSCGTQVPRGTPQIKRVTRKRSRIYSQHWIIVRNTKKAKEDHIWRDLPRSKSGGKKDKKPRRIEILVPNHTGWEIAEEQRICIACLKRTV